jgi:hypothetical protein
VFAPVRDSVGHKTSPSAGSLEKILGAVSIVTMLATVPQVIDVWFGQSVGGVSLVSWAAYLAGACLWFVHGIQKRDPSIYVACIGWIALDAAVVAGILVRQM